MFTEPVFNALQESKEYYKAAWSWGGKIFAKFATDSEQTPPRKFDISCDPKRTSNLHMYAYNDNNSQRYPRQEHPSPSFQASNLNLNKV